jgi:signal transduction histidine kinase
MDAAKIERVVENLLANAARHTTPDTPVWVKVVRRSEGVLLAVEDAGGGVPQELRATLFEPFRQGPGAAAHAPGVGIGLSLVARFAELHCGRAWVQDRPGGGASFQVLLPDPPTPQLSATGT